MNLVSAQRIKSTEVTMGSDEINSNSVTAEVS